MTNREIAQHLGISPAALSIIINNKKGVSDETRRRITESLEKMGYKNLIKSPDSGSQTKTLYFIVFKKDNTILDVQPFFTLLMEYVEQWARQYNYGIMLFTFDARNPIEPQRRYLKNLNASGAIIFATEMSAEDIAYFKDLEIPYVMVDNAFNHIPINSIVINNDMGTFQAVEYLIKKGHTKIGYLRSSNRISSFQEREAGYKGALHSFGLTLEPDYIFTVESNNSYMDFLKILESSPALPTAFVSDDDTIADGVMKALMEHGFRIPDDISIVGYNNRPICEFTVPPLTTISVSKYSYAVEAVNSLITMIQNRQKSNADFRTKKIRIETSLYERESVKDISTE